MTDTTDTTKAKADVLDEIMDLAHDYAGAEMVLDAMVAADKLRAAIEAAIERARADERAKWQDVTRVWWVESDSSVRLSLGDAFAPDCGIPLHAVRVMPLAEMVGGLTAAAKREADRKAQQCPVCMAFGGHRVGCATLQIRALGTTGEQE